MELLINVTEILCLQLLLNSSLHSFLFLYIATGALVISTYACCPDITATVTPDLKCPDNTGKKETLHELNIKGLLGNT